jgi:hypothetical protein
MIVREYIEFKRPSGNLSAKDLGIGRRIPGKLFKYGDSHRPEYPTIYMYLEEEPKYHLYYYIGRFINPEESFTGYNFKFTENTNADGAWNAQSKENDKMIPLSPEEKEKLRVIISDPDNEDIIKRIERSSGVSRINESMGFQRGMSDREIRDTLIGWHEGQFVINPYTNIVYVYLQTWGGENDIEVFSVGHLRTKGEKKIFQTYKKRTDADWARTNFKRKKNLSPLSNEEWKIVKPTLTPEYINKLESNFGIKVIIP